MRENALVVGLEKFGSTLGFEGRGICVVGEVIETGEWLFFPLKAREMRPSGVASVLA